MRAQELRIFVNGEVTLHYPTFIPVHRRKKYPTIRVLLVEVTQAQFIFEGFVLWSKCRLWINRLSSPRATGDELTGVRKLLDTRQLVTIKEVQATLRELDLLGLQRVDSYE